ncbi:MAG TPA: rRNA maturation RNase YbeY [Cyclobacteriaceae bacterium]|nr:rRNA maturation RNase YbeY [Cyclobacteriaceae bacterium]
MPKGRINYFTEDLAFQLPQKQKTRRWIAFVIEKEGFQLAEINFIFCSDQYLHSINKAHLNHDTLTDIITFPYSAKGEALIADIFISITRVKENALALGESFSDEINRVMIHGVLHLMGYKDKSAAQKAEMRKKESACLSLRKRFT